MKYTTWLYVATYTILLLLMLLMVIVTDNANTLGVFQSVAALIPVFVAIEYLLSNKKHTILAIIGLIAVALPLTDAHKFSSIEHVTLVMYIWFAPMLLFMAFIAYAGITNKT